MWSPTQTRGGGVYHCPSPRYNCLLGRRWEFSVMMGAGVNPNWMLPLNNTGTRIYIHHLHGDWHVNWEHQHRKDQRRARSGLLPAPSPPAASFWPIMVGQWGLCEDAQVQWKELQERRKGGSTGKADCQPCGPGASEWKRENTTGGRRHHPESDLRLK